MLKKLGVKTYMIILYTRWLVFVAIFILIGTQILQLNSVMMSSSGDNATVLVARRRRRRGDGNSTSTAVLVPLTTIIEKNLQFIPGVYQFGLVKNESESIKSSLVIIGASITGDYHHLNDDKLWFQLFAMGKRMFEKKLTRHNPICYFTNETMNSTLHANGGLKMWHEMEDEIFLCQIGNQKHAMVLVPTRGVDPNTNEMLQVWRCPINALLSEMDMHRIRRHSVSDNLALGIDILYKDKTTLSITTVTTIYLPINEPNVGNYRITSDLPRPFLQQRHNMTLCIVTHPNGIVYLNEFIRYHHDVIGIDHFHLGIFISQDEESESKSILSVINSLFKHDIDSGILTVSAIWDTEFLGIRCGSQDVPKICFYQQCLYRAKSTSEFLGTWDLDEYFLFNGTEEAKTKQKYLPDFLRNTNHEACQEWSYMTMESSFAGGRPVDKDPIGLAVFDAPRREIETNTRWHKSISRTNRVFLNSFHVPGSCLEPGKDDVKDVIPMHPSKGNCAFYTDEAIMVHMRGLVRGWNKVDKKEEETVENEVRQLMIGHPNNG